MSRFKASISKIIEDNVSGSTKILDQCIHVLTAYLEEKEIPDKEEISGEMIRLVRHFPQFIVLFHFVNELLKQLEDHSNNGENLLQFLSEYKERWSNSSTRVAEQAINIPGMISQSILVHSNSSTIHALFRLMAEENFPAKVYQTISRPANEGIEQAKVIANAGFEIKMLEDAAINRFMPEVSMAFCGADHIGPDSLINKCGTSYVGFSCREYNVPFYVLADSRKILDPRMLPKQLQEHFREEKPKPAREIASGLPSNIQAVNYYFEEIPNELVTGFITEKEVILPSKIESGITGFKLSRTLRESFS